jgi:hypothetical protein
VRPFLKGKRGEVWRLDGAEGGLQRRATWQTGRPKVAAGVWMSTMTKENWVGGLNARLG